MMRSRDEIYCCQDNMLSLPSLPSLPKLEKLQMERRRQKELIRRREQEKMEQERAAAKRKEEQERMKQDQVERAQKIEMKDETNSLIKGGGWVAPLHSVSPASSSFETEDADSDADDPILEQIANVERMLYQAEAVNRVEEADSLRKNLKELKDEHKRLNIERGFGGFRSNTPSNPFIEDQKNPFLVDDDVEPVKRNRPKNPFLEDESKNPFLEEEEEAHIFCRDDKRNQDVKDPMLEQIQYITKCLDEAVKMGRTDEILILKENLRELQLAYEAAK